MRTMRRVRVPDTVVSRRPATDMPERRRPTTDASGAVDDRRATGATTAPTLDPREASGSSPKRTPGATLPLELSSFVGRERELSEVEGILFGARLLTLVGPGGCGKTRLALRVAADLEGPKNLPEVFADGVRWVDLSSLPDPRLVPDAMASALGAHEAPDLTRTEALVAVLGAQDVLLVIDNCEHLIGAVAELADALLRSCPGLKILATSRESLGVPGEVCWPVPPLSLPGPRDAGAKRNTRALLRFGAVRLFDERARAASPSFVLTRENASAVGELCLNLDGMPLAIELAASRTTALSPEQILGRLHDRFRLLTGGRSSGGRHKTLRATIDWSHDLLSEKEKVLFRRLSVFSGGWTLPAAEEVCAGGGIDGNGILDLLSGLVDKSLVMVSQDGSANEARYRLLETIRQYGYEMLLEAGGAQATRRRHADFYLTVAEEAESRIEGPKQTAWLGRLEHEHDNLRAALRWFEDEREAEQGLRLAAALVRFWWFRGHYAEGRARLEGLLDLRSTTPVRDVVLAKALDALGLLIMIHRRTDYAAGDLNVARSHLEEGLEIYRRLGDETCVAAALVALGRVKVELGEWASAQSNLDEGLTIARRSDDKLSIALSLFHMGAMRFRGGELVRARAELEESLEIFRRLNDKFWIPACLVFLGYIDCEEGALDAARSRFVETNEVLPLAQFSWGATFMLEGFARLATAEGQAARALRLAGATDTLRRTFGVAIGPLGEAAFERSLEPAWQALGDEEATAAWEQGRTMALEEALAFALGDAEGEPEDHSPESRLTSREAEVLSLVAEGLSDIQVAERLYLSPRTVGGHLRGAYRKLGVKSRTAATRKARELGLI